MTRFQAAIGEDSQFALAYSKLAQSQAELGQDDEAEQDAQKAVSLSGALPAQEKYLIQANRDRILKDYPKAIEAYQNLVGVASDNADYLYELATAYESAGNYDKAKELFTKVVKLDPKQNRRAPGAGPRGNRKRQHPERPGVSYSRASHVHRIER